MSSGRDLVRTRSRTVSSQQHPFRKDFAAFKADLDNVYLDRNYRDRCARRLLALRQTKSASAYSVEFKSLVEHLDYSPDGKRDLYFEHLNPTLKATIAIQGRAPTFEDLIDQSIRIDQAQFDAQKAQGSSSRSNDANQPAATTLPPASKKFLDNPITRSTPAPTPTLAPNPKSAPSSKPAPRPNFGSHPRPPLTDAEKQRRRDNNLCMYCGDPGHSIDACPRRPLVPVNYLSQDPMGQQS
jgi:hypothetical protein